MSRGNASTWTLDRFQGGIDLRDGLYAENQSRFRELLNAYIDKGGKIRRRCPCRQVDGLFDANSQGAISVDGQKYTFAPKGTTITNTGDVGSDVDVLYFDMPDLAESTWELAHAEVFDGYAAAVIIHDYPSDTYPKIAFLHLWDLLLYSPTYVGDPAFPGSFSPSIVDLTDQEYDSDFIPGLDVGVTKLNTTSLGGNTKTSRTADARVWNERSKDSLLQDGEWWAYVVPEGDGMVSTFTVPRDADTLPLDGRWAYYVLEYDDNGAFVPMEEVTGVPSVGFTYRTRSVTSRFAGGWAEIKLDVCWGRATAGIIRFRLVAGATSLILSEEPSVSSTPGTGSLWKLEVGEAKYQYRGGDEVTVPAYVTDDLLADKTYILSVSSDSLNFPELLNITDDGFPDGWNREHRCLIKTIITTSTTTPGTTEYHAPWLSLSTMTGTVTINSGTNGVVGVGTLFLSQVEIGEKIFVNGELRTVQTITDNLNLTVSVNWGSTAAAIGIERADAYATYTGSETHVYVDAALAAVIVVNNVLRINGIDYLVYARTGQDVTIRSSSGVAGNYVNSVNRLYTVTRLTTPAVTDYNYAFEADTTSQWYTDRVVEYIDQAGAEDAVTMATASHDNTGGKIAAIASLKNRMLICYPGSSQLWAIDQATSATSFLDQLSFGTGDQVYPSPVSFYGSIIIPTPTGWRSISAVGSNLDSLQDTNIGEPITDLEMPSVRHAVFWPWFGFFIVAGTDDDGSTRFMVFSYSRESKISAWSKWIVDGIDEVDVGSFIVDESRLYFRSGRGFYYFDALATEFIDFDDTPGEAYLTEALWHYNDFGRPGQSKRFTAFDIVQDGSSQLSFLHIPLGASGSPVGIEPSAINVSGITYGFTRRGVAMTAPAIAPRLQSRDETGWRLQRLAIDYKTLRR